MPNYANKIKKSLKKKQGTLKNMPYDPRCIVKIPKVKTPFYNSDYEYYVRPKCLKVI